MSRVVRFVQPKTVDVVDEEDPPLGSFEVRLRTLFSGISAGTEMSFYRGVHPNVSKGWDSRRRLYVDRLAAPTAVGADEGPARFPRVATRDYPVAGSGYEEVGRVVEVGGEVSGVEVGDVVWGAWGHRSSAVRPADYVRQRVLDPGADPLLGIFSNIGAVALNAVLDADVHVGETVAVFGAGVPGQITAQLARMNGARVIVVDLSSRRLEMARQLGAWKTIAAGDGGVAEQVHDLTENRGADVCIEISGSYRALHEAIRSVAYSARVVAAGFFQAGGSDLYLGEELHHNRVQVVSSQGMQVSPALSYRWDSYRLQRSVIDAAVAGKLELAPLVSHTLAAEEAAKAFGLLDQPAEDVLQVVLRY